MKFNLDARRRVAGSSWLITVDKDDNDEAFLLSEGDAALNALAESKGFNTETEFVITVSTVKIANPDVILERESSEVPQNPEYPHYILPQNILTLMPLRWSVNGYIRLCNFYIKRLFKRVPQRLYIQLNVRK